MAEAKRDYGPAGCADGCATSGCGSCLLVIVAGLLALVGIGRAARRGSRAGERRG